MPYDSLPPPALTPCPLLKAPVSYRRKRITRPIEQDVKKLEALHRAYLSGLADGLQDGPVCETLYPNAVAARYALGYSLGRAWRPQS